MRSLRRLRCSILKLGLWALMAPAAFAQVGTENFSGALGSNWVSPISYTDSGTVSSSLATGSNRLNWTASITGAVGGGSSDALLTWNSTLAYGSDWAVTLDVNNSFSPQSSSSSNVQLGLRFWNAADSSDAVKLVLDQSDFGAATNRFHSLFTGPGTTALGDSTGTVGTTGTLGISFDSASKIVTTLYDNGAGWVQIGSFGIDSGGGSTANADWDMTSGSTFRIGIFATAGIFADNVSLTLGSGTTFADDFSVTNSTLAAVPEPASAALMLGGAAALGAVAWRGWRRNAAKTSKAL